MLEISAKINGTLIINITAVNSGYANPDGKYLYYYEIYRKGEHVTEGKIASGNLHHHRELGLEELAKKLFKISKKMIASPKKANKNNNIGEKII